MNRNRYIINMAFAKRLQKWALKVSGAKEKLDTLQEIDQSKKKDGIYVDYSLDESEFDGGYDYPDVGVAFIYAVYNGDKNYLGELRAYNFETYWLSIREDDEVDTVEHWFELIMEDYKKNFKKNNTS
ncbi:MAG: hypothetical protein ACMXYK_01485 [Candidatus Woesearchaeota archaeon]